MGADEESTDFETEDEISESSSEDEILAKYGTEEDNQSLCIDAATDAVNNATMTIHLSLEDVKTMEKELDFYEKVSLVYLLFDNATDAIAQLQLVRGDASSPILYNWAKQARSKWADKLVESLCIIQNYQILKQWGYSREDLNSRFLPSYPLITVNVHKTRKVLYRICESLTEKERNKLIEILRQDLIQRGLESRNFDDLYLEMYFLHFEYINYISLTNLERLQHALKQMDLLDYCDMLKGLQPPSASPPINFQNSKTTDYPQEIETQPEEIFELLLNNNAGLDDLISLQSSPSGSSLKAELDRYFIDPEKPGVCLIINQIDYYLEPNEKYHHLLPEPFVPFEKREGSEKDRDSLDEVMSKFGFRTIIRENLSHLEIVEVIKEAVEAFSGHSSLFVCIMAHGVEGYIFGTNSCRVEVSEIQSVICHKNLIGKPKVLILQSCQGVHLQKVANPDDDYAIDGPVARPLTTDFLTFWATIPGFSAIRHKRNGAWFIQSLCNHMLSLGNQLHFEDICTRIVNDVSSQNWKKQGMVPFKSSTFGKSLYLPILK